MCVDYTDLNKHCPKDPFGLPRIDQVVDSTAGCKILSSIKVMVSTNYIMSYLTAQAQITMDDPLWQVWQPTREGRPQ
jgi:hypothetical protein